MIDHKSGKRYEGEFQDDSVLGNGIIKYQNGDVYQGKVEKLLKQGAGRLECSKSGKVFEGQFNKDMKEGIGYYFN